MILAFGFTQLLTVHSGYAQVASTSAGTDIPHTLSYQGVVKSIDGAPVSDGSYSMTARLYSDASGSTMIWEGTYTVDVRNGSFSMILGSGNTPLPHADKLNGQVWMGLQIGETKELRPLTPLTASPYALSVADASISKEKMATDYVGSLSINGAKITGRGEDVNIVAGDGMRASVDPGTNTVVVSADPSSSTLMNDLKHGQISTNTVVTGTLTVFSACIFNTNGGSTTLGSNTAGNPGILGLYQGSPTGHLANLRAPSTMSTDLSYTLPTVGGALLNDPGQTGNAGKVLETDGSVVSWQNVGTVTSIATGTGLTGGPISTSGTISLANTTVVPGSYTSANITVDAQGRLTAASNGPGGTVTSVDVSGGTTGLTTTGGPITSSGTITLGGVLAISHGGTGAGLVARNLVFAGPVSGADAAPSFRALGSADVPSGSGSYIQNQTAIPQVGANFNIDGFGKVLRDFGVGGSIDAGQFYSIGGNKFLSSPGTRNTFLGQSSGTAAPTGTDNTFTGDHSGSAITSGSGNSFAGSPSGHSMTTESNNSFYGSHSDGLAGITNASAIGYQAYAGQSNSLVLGSISGVNGAATSTSVGIGTTTPTAALDIRSTGPSLSIGPFAEFVVAANGNLDKIDGVPYFWPAAQGTNGSVLTDNGAGSLQWRDNINVPGNLKTGGHIIATSTATAASADAGVIVSDVPVFIITTGSATANFPLSMPAAPATGDLIVVINHDATFSATFNTTWLIAPNATRTFYFDGSVWQ